MTPLRRISSLRPAGGSSQRLSSPSQHAPGARLQQARQAAHDRALAAAAAAHDDEDIAAADVEAQVALHQGVAVAELHALQADVRCVALMSLRRRHDRPMASKRMVSTAAAMTMNKMAVTTAEVVASPTAAALRPHCMPRRQPEAATMAP
jgi:hypothetical protein